MDEHPDGHGHHHEVFGEGDEAEGDLAASADAGAVEVTFVEINGFDHRDGADGADEEGGGSGKPGEESADHEDSRSGFDERINVGVGHVAPGDEVVLHEAGGEGLQVLKLQDAEHAHADGDEQFADTHGIEGAEADPANGECHEKGDREYGDHGLVGLPLFRIGTKAEVLAQCVVTANVFTFDEDLRCLVVAVVLFVLVIGLG